MKVDKKLDERTSSDRVFQTRAAAIGKARSPTVDRFDVGTANVSDDHDRSLCLDGKFLTHQAGITTPNPYSDWVVATVSSDSLVFMRDGMN